MKDAFLPVSAREAERRALEWQSGIDSKSKVGARHHIVPHFHLSRFANERDQLAVRDRVTGALSLRAAGDMAVTDFYTFLSISGELDSSFESWFEVIESGAAEVFHRHLDTSAFARPRPFTSEERARLDTFVSAQMTRGMRARRVLELLADYHTKLTNQDRLSPEDIEKLTFVPHQNDHLRAAAYTSENIAEHLARRPLLLVRLDRPLLLIGDEPVVMVLPDGWEGFAVSEPDAYPNVTGPGIRAEDVIHFSHMGPGLLHAEEIAMPLSPTALLIYGKVGDLPRPAPQYATGAAALTVAREMNKLTVDGAVGWVAGSPDHPTLRSMNWPVPPPMLHVTDGGTVMGKQLNLADHRRPHRLRHP